ncbi:hypothetical protein GCM10027071_03360 [Microbacterium marinum]
MSPIQVCQLTYMSATTPTVMRISPSTLKNVARGRGRRRARCERREGCSDGVEGSVTIGF